MHAVADTVKQAITTWCTEVESSGGHPCPRAAPVRPLELVFTNVNVTVDKRPILKDVSGFVKPGQVLAIMGPSGSGKTTLLNCLAGRIKLDGGQIRLNRDRMCKRWRRKICYVLQQDIFFPDLTLRQTLEYSALLRLPDSLSHSQKMQYVDHIMDVLDLQNCRDTIIGDYMKRGLSGGEKKRASIACELLTNPMLMLMDEPTSGLDSHSAYSLMTCLKRYAEKEGKTVVVTLHQPSSQVFHMFDKLLLLCSGQVAYFGDAERVVDFFGSVGLTIAPNYNPADFILEQVKGSDEVREKVLAAAREARLRPDYPRELRPEYFSQDNICDKYNNYNNFNENQVHSSGPARCKCGQGMWSKNDAGQLNQDSVCVQVALGDTSEAHNHVYTTIAVKEDEGKTLWLDNQSHESSSVSSSEDDLRRRWPTSFMTQFKVLCHRNFVEARPRMLSKLNWILTLSLAVMAGLLWLQMERKEENLDDIQGWMFFTTTFWMLFAHFGALAAFPAEREVINKERRSGAYRLSAYYWAKLFGELPLAITLPAVYHVISYPMMGVHSASVFFALLGFILLNSVVAQSVGLFVGACCMDLEVAITYSAIYTLAVQLFGGFYASNIPYWLTWVRYLSMAHYAYQNMQIVEFGNDPMIECSKQSKFEVCRNATHIPAYDILMAQGVEPLPLWANSLILIGFLIVFRMAGYLVLRYIRKPQ